MADIKQAAVWMQDGKRVRRSVYRPGIKHGFTDSPAAHPDFAVFIYADEQHRILSENNIPVSFLLDALLADDWEIDPSGLDAVIGEGK